jgi:gliding motility-associated lipoprotein GldD
MRRLSLIFLVLTLVACESDYTPKPMGYFRIGLPEKSYSTLEDNSCNYSFGLNDAASFKEVANRNCWADVVYPDLKATVQLTYYNLKEKDLEGLLKEGQRMAYSHTSVADGMQERFYDNPEKRVYGLVYRMKGHVATSTQFYLTDSTDNFLRGVLYFYSSPNPDSLRDVNEFMQGEIIQMVESLEWKNGLQ